MHSSMTHSARLVAIWSTFHHLHPGLVAALPASDKSQRLQSRANDGFIETLTDDQINLLKARLQESAVGRCVIASTSAPLMRDGNPI